MEILTIIPARGGSKGIPGKNIVPLLGKPLLGYAIESAQASGIIDHLWVSTDSNEIAEVARLRGSGVIQRPEALSVDSASTESALLHALDYVEKNECKTFDAILTLQPTSPLRTPETIRRFVETFQAETFKYDALLSLHRDTSDFWVQHQSGGFKRLDPQAPRRRQDRKPLFVENSCMYLTTASALRETGFILGRTYDGFEIPALEAIDINEPIDLLLAEAALNYVKSRH